MESISATVTDAELIHLNKLPKLPTLKLNYIEITDARLVHLKGLTNLKSLNVQGTQVTRAGVAELKQALPKCRIRK